MCLLKINEKFSKNKPNTKIIIQETVINVKCLNAIFVRFLRKIKKLVDENNLQTET